MDVEKVLGRLPEGWAYTTLGRVCKAGGGDVQTGPFGSQLHAADYVEFGVPSIMPTNIGDNRVIEDGIARITPKDAERLRRYQVRTGDIVYSRRGDVERRALIREHEDGWLCGTGCLRVRLGDRGTNPRFASYYLSHPRVREWITRHAQGATMLNLNTSILAACPFVLPPPQEQRAIARILGALDDKIELNQKMNKTLEAIARAIFKSWFVNFDPVRAKIEGRDPGLPAEIADLFPDSLEESQLGEIPSGWTTRSIGDIGVEIVSGSRPKGGAVSDGIPSIGAENVLGLGLHDYSKEKYIPVELFRRLALKGAAVKDGDILLYKDGAQLGRKTYVDCGFPHDVCAVNEHVFILRSSPMVPSRYLFFWLDLPSTTAAIVNLNSNSAQPGINQRAVRQLRVLVPSVGAMECYDRLVNPMLSSIFTRCKISRTLAGLRDALLPKLISGQLRIADAERLIEEVV